MHLGAIASKIKHAIKLKTRLAQLLQPSLALCFSLQPLKAHWTVRRHWLQAETMLMRAAAVVLCKSCRTCFKFYCMFYFSCDHSLNVIAGGFSSGHQPGLCPGGASVAQTPCSHPTSTPWLCHL